MTDADEALLYAREQMADDLLQNGGSAEDVAAARAGAFDTLLKVAADFYRAGAAASAERIKELEAALRDALPHLETCFTHHVWRNEPMPEPGYLKNIRALLKEPDQ